jgi:hypothetical protein
MPPAKGQSTQRGCDSGPGATARECGTRPPSFGRSSLHKIPNLSRSGAHLLSTLTNRYLWSGTPAFAGFPIGSTVVASDASPPRRHHLEFLSCATARHEVIEALRWARELLVGGEAQAEEVAISAASPEPTMT